ncbi:MAG TPA: hypothetical protein VLA94_04740 [Syntrophales bacterium]|nr:hypothetical protein [Syntrophales bacterium]
MSYFNAVRKAGTCRNGDCEENDYIYDAPHLSTNVSSSAPGTSYYAIEHKVHDMIHLTPDAWEDLLLPIAA